MIFEKWETKFDILRLQKHIQKYVLPLEPARQSSSFGGWSVLSSDGNFQDGWAQGHLHLQAEMTPEEIFEGKKKAGLKKTSEYCIPTEICHGYLKEVIDFVHSKNLHPLRARVIQLTAGLASSWHRDAADHVYSVRLHIPIITNQECYFEIEADRAHLPANGDSYFLKVNRMHRVVNGGLTPRYHLVMDVYDIDHVSQFHRYEALN